MSTTRIDRQKFRQWSSKDLILTFAEQMMCKYFSAGGKLVDRLDVFAGLQPLRCLGRHAQNAHEGL